MNLELGSHRFQNVEIPILWGERAIVADKAQRLAIIDLSGPTATLEILANRPAPRVPYEPVGAGFKILDKQKSKALYVFDPESNTLTALSLDLPEIQIDPMMVRVGTNRFSTNTVSGFGVGIAVTSEGISIGAPLPPGLARLKIQTRGPNSS